MAFLAIDDVFHRHHRITHRRQGDTHKERRRIPEVSGRDKVKQDVGWELFGTESSNTASHGRKRLAGIENEAVKEDQRSQIISKTGSSIGLFPLQRGIDQRIKYCVGYRHSFIEITMSV